MVVWAMREDLELPADPWFARASATRGSKRPVASGAAAVTC